jgi:hypothetical protein
MWAAKANGTQSNSSEWSNGGVHLKGLTNSASPQPTGNVSGTSNSPASPPPTNNDSSKPAGNDSDRSYDGILTILPLSLLISMILLYF